MIIGIGDNWDSFRDNKNSFTFSIIMFLVTFDKDLHQWRLVMNSNGSKQDLLPYSLIQSTACAFGYLLKNRSLYTLKLPLIVKFQG